GQEGGNGLACRLPHPWCIQLATYLEVEDEKAFPPVAADPLTSAARHDWPWRLPPRALDAQYYICIKTCMFIKTRMPGVTLHRIERSRSAKNPPQAGLPLSTPCAE